MLHHMEKTLLLQGKGETEKEALQHVFQQIRPKLEETKEVLLRIEPKDMKILDAVIQTRTERFLGFLFPRKLVLYTIKAEITVSVCSLSAKSIHYRQENEELSMLQHILEMR